MSPSKILLSQIRSIKKARDRCDLEYSRCKTSRKKEALQYACEALTFTEFKLEAELDSLLTSKNGQISN
jgi:hypothetical protein